jgi:hypothetical protein
MDPVLVVRGVGSWSQPHLVVELRRHRLLRGIPRLVRLLGENYLNPLQLANSPVPHQLSHPMIFRHSPIFRAGLKHFLVLAHGLDQEFAFVDGKRRFLALHILPGMDGQQADQGVPVIWGRDHHRIDVFSGEDFPEIFSGKAILVLVPVIDRLFGTQQAPAIDIAHRDHARLFVPEVRRQVPADAMVASADEPDGNLVARGDFTCSTEDSRSNDQGRGNSHCDGALEKAPAGAEGFHETRST